MTKIIRVSLFVLSIFILQTTSVFATGYNYLPNDVYIKQQEEKSALEYRLKQLENSFSGNSSSQISSLSARISQLESERTTEKNYISGVYAQSGIANQLPAKLAEIDAKYNTQISSLQSQKSALENITSNQQSSQVEIANLKLEIAKLKAQMVDDELQANLKALEKYQIQEKQSSYYSEADLLKLYNYLDSLSAKDAYELYSQIKAKNEDVASRLTELQNKKYPNGKTGTSKNIEYLKSIQKDVVAPTSKKTEKPALKQEIKKTEEKPVIELQVEQAKPQPEPVQIQKPIEKKTTIGQKVSGFFKRVFSWGK